MQSEHKNISWQISLTTKYHVAMYGYMLKIRPCLQVVARFDGDHVVTIDVDEQYNNGNYDDSNGQCFTTATERSREVF